jgi:heme/copper-type cytochrome/quinol oxidase subunit 2
MTDLQRSVVTIAASMWLLAASHADDVTGLPAHTALGTADQPREFTITAHRYAFAPARIEVNHGDIVRITLVADDIPHTWTLDAYRISKRAAPGTNTTIEFRADLSGTHVFYCSLTSDSGCRDMRGELVVR